MSAGLNDENVESVGASGAIFGVVGCFIGIIVVNWKIMANAPTTRCMMICSVVMVIILNILFSFSMQGAYTPGSSTPSTDNWAHFGGF